MLDRKRLEPHAVDRDGFSQVTALRMDQIPCLLGRIDRTRSARGKASGVIRMRMPAQIEIAATRLGDQTAAKSPPLLGITYAHPSMITTGQQP